MNWPIKRDEFGCERWRGERDASGYGRIDRALAHRVRWEREVGPLGPNTMLDHLCRRRDCVALHHLEPVKQSENERRKLWRHRLRTHCRLGHELTLYAVITPEGGRVCRMCNREMASK